MIRSRCAVVLFSAAFLAASVPLSFAEDSPQAAYLRQNLLEGNDPAVAANFLDDQDAQRTLKASDPALYREVFLRAAELKDLQGVLSGVFAVQSIRLSLLARRSCSFCLDPIAFPAWAKKHMPYLGEQKFKVLDDAMWSWGALSPTQKPWIEERKKSSDWSKMGFLDRHGLMRAWALEERGVLLKIDPADAAAVNGFHARAWAAQKVLGNHEMTEVWRRLEQARQAAASMAEARAKVGKSADPRQKALLAEAVGAASPEARLAALSRLFENRGEQSRELLAAAPPRPDQRFDDESREVVGKMLKDALLEETEGTYAGDDLKEFYIDRKVPLEIKFMNTSMSALGWYEHGTDALNFNERYVEKYLKSRGLSVNDLKLDKGGVLGDLARTLVGTFVHEAQHHRQDVWARDNKVPRLYHQGDEVEAFQTQALFLMEKMDRDSKFKVFASSEAEHSDVLKIGLGRAQRMREEGPDYFDWTVPNAHYPEILSNEAQAWCGILWHNRVVKTIEAELARRESLPIAKRLWLEIAPALKNDYPDRDKFLAVLSGAGSASLRAFTAKAKEDAEQAPEIFAKLRARQEAGKKLTMERFKILESGGKRTKMSVEPPAPEGR